MDYEEIGKRETLPERVCKIIKESILNGELKPGDALPTEPELEKQFGVSRAVIRDAVRMLTGQGLLNVKHGKGMFVSLSQTEAFTDSLLTSLRRNDATAWDVEQFEQILFPQIFSLASMEATDTEITNIKKAAGNYLLAFKKLADEEKTAEESRVAKLISESSTCFADFMSLIFKSTHNKLIILLGDVLVSMRKWRTISGITVEETKLVEYETNIINRFVKAVEIKNPDKAAAIILESISYNSSITSIMKNTPVGESPEIPGEVFFQAYKKLEE